MEEARISAALFFSPQILNISYGPGHPFEVERLADVLRLCHAFGLLPSGDSPIAFGPADRSQLECFHTPAYVDALEESESLSVSELMHWGIGMGDNPIFPGLWTACLLTAGGSIEAAGKILVGLDKGECRRAFHPGGGLHHAMKDRASGFCYVNDGVLAIKEMTAAGKRVCYIDVDAHHGDGVQSAFYEDDSVLTISVHQDGRTIFPGTGFPNEIGRGKGEGYSVNVPLLPGAVDSNYEQVLEEIIKPLVETYEPDILVTEIGVDSLRDDPLALLNWTLDGLGHFLDWVAGTGLPWLALGGGGYRRWNVIRGWSLVWAKMLGVELPRRRPEEDSQGRLPESWPHSLFDEPPERTLTTDDSRGKHLEQTFSVLRELVFPRLGR